MQVDKYRRKVLDLSKTRHLQRVRVAKEKVQALSLNDPVAAAKTKAGSAGGVKGVGGSSGGRGSAKRGEDADNRWDVSEEQPANERLAEILQQESKHDQSKIALLFLSFIGVAGLDMAKELAPCGSQSYVLSTLLTIPYVLVFFFGYRSYLMKRQKEKLACGFEFLKGDVQWDERSTILYPLLCVFAGFFAGMFGVGGGIIKGPLMLEMGILPQVAAANAAAMILFTTATACLSFFLFGAVDHEVASLLFVLGIVCTGVGQFVVGVAIKRANRQSLIILSMGSVVVLSAFLLTLRSLLDAATRPGGIGALVEMGSLCEASSGASDGEAPHRRPHGVSPSEYFAEHGGGQPPTNGFGFGFGGGYNGGGSGSGDGGSGNWGNQGELYRQGYGGGQNWNSGYGGDWGDRGPN
jgi:uncharacterized membrane protein YfcA